MRQLIRIFALTLIFTTGNGYITSCRNSYTPKPMGYPRINMPEKAYEIYDEQPNFSFEIPVYAEVQPGSGAREGWIDLVFPDLNGSLYLSYKDVNENLDAYISDSRALAYKHTVKADGIEESPFIDREHRQFGMVYDLKGNVASALQFFLTDSTSHFLRGSLYFNCPPNQDSLKPLVDFLREDVIHLIESTRWKYE